MLERAPAYFEHGGRQFLRTSAIHSVRGSRALRPPIGHNDSHPRPSPRLLEESNPRQDGSCCGEQNLAADAYLTGADGSFLYFLYPNRTLALMSRFDSSSRGGWRNRLLDRPTVGHRHYSSKHTSMEEPKKTDSKGKNVGEDSSDEVQPKSSAEEPGEKEQIHEKSTAHHAEEVNDSLEMALLDGLDETNLTDQEDGFEGVEMDYEIPRKSWSKNQPVEEAVDVGGKESPLDVSHFIESTERSDDRPKALVNLIELYANTRIDNDSRDALPLAIWRLWNTIPAEEKKPKLATAMLEHLGSIRPFLRTHAERIIEVYESLSDDCKLSKSWDSAILAYLTIHGPGKAALVYFKGAVRALLRTRYPNLDLLEHKPFERLGRAALNKLRPRNPEPLISRAIADGEWQLAADVIATAQKFGDINWSLVGNDLDLHNHLTMLLIRIRQLQRLGAGSKKFKRQFRILVLELAKQTIAQMTASWSAESSQVQLWRLLLRLKRSGFVTATVEANLHAHALEGILHAKEITKHRYLPPVVFKIYNTFVLAARQNRKRLGIRDTRTGGTTLVCMLHGFLRHPELPAKQPIDPDRVYDDYQFLVGQPSFSVLSVLMHYHANKVNDVKVKAYFKDLVNRHKHKIAENSVVFRSMFYVLSQKGDVAGIEKLIKYMREEFDLTPDPQMWNSVLKAHTRKDDLAGAWEVLRNMTRVTKLTGASFRIIMEPLANRGDVDAVKELFDMISELDPDMLRDSRTVCLLVLAYVKSGDLSAAERFAMHLQGLKKEGNLEGETTYFWNIVASEYARQRDVQAVQRIMAFMKEHEAPYDAHTYSALLLALVNIHQTDVAYKILRTVITKEPVEKLALHYGIVMSGYINQGRYLKVWYVDRFRQHRRVQSSFSTRSALVQALLRIEAQMSRETGSNDFQKTEKMVFGQLRLNEPWDVGREMQYGAKFTPVHQLRDAWLDTLILTFGRKKMFDMSKKMFDVYAQRNNVDFADPQRTPPVRILVALMGNFLSAGQHAEVEQCWHLAKQQADASSQLRPANMAGEFASQEDASVRKSPFRRNMLSHALSVYMASLKQQERVEDIQLLVQSLLSEGYKLSNSIWNSYIQLLARSGRFALAFSLAERELMPRWPGWRNPRWVKTRRYKRGWDYLYVSALREPPGTKLPSYKTMVFLAAAVKYLRRAEAVGTGGATVVTEAFLQKRAPITMKAVSTMPRIDDPLQTRYLGD